MPVTIRPRNGSRKGRVDGPGDEGPFAWPIFGSVHSGRARAVCVAENNVGLRFGKELWEDIVAIERFAK